MFEFYNFICNGIFFFISPKTNHFQFKMKRLYFLQDLCWLPTKLKHKKNSQIELFMTPRIRNDHKSEVLKSHFIRLVSSLEFLVILQFKPLFRIPKLTGMFYVMCFYDARWSHFAARFRFYFHGIVFQYEIKWGV